MTNKIETKKLHLGCGKKIIPGWINIDAVPQSPDVVLGDVSSLSNIEDCSISEIYACHVLEHFGRNHISSILKVWHQKLHAGGTIRISVPDIQSVFLKYQKGTPLPVLLGLLYGGQRNEYDYHKIGFDFSTIKLALEEAGFSDVSRYDWHLTTHAEMDDYSQAYLPHMDKENGVLMSLNVEARKAL